MTEEHSQWLVPPDSLDEVYGVLAGRNMDVLVFGADLGSSALALEIRALSEVKWGALGYFRHACRSSDLREILPRIEKHGTYLGRFRTNYHP